MSAGWVLSTQKVVAAPPCEDTYPNPKFCCATATKPRRSFLPFRRSAPASLPHKAMDNSTMTQPHSAVSARGYGYDDEKSPVPSAKPKAEPMKGVVSSFFLYPTARSFGISVIFFHHLALASKGSSSSGTGTVEACNT